MMTKWIKQYGRTDCRHLKCYQERKGEEMTKAYRGGLYSDDDAGNAIVFAKNAKEAKSKFMGHHHGIADYAENYIDIYALRAPEFDGMENASDAELMCEQWKRGWWFHQGDVPDVETATDEEFYEWYKDTFFYLRSEANAKN